MKRLTLLLTGIFLSVSAAAQDGESPISYKSLALQMSTLNTNGDAISSVTTSVSSFNGYGSFIDNPASMALADGSFYSIGWLNQSNTQSNGYIGNSNNTEFSNTTFGNLGLVYKVPTERGSFVIGGGYNVISKDADETFLDAFNQTNSITDLFKQSGSDYNGIAFEAFAVDFRNDMSNEIESIFRVDGRPSGFEGINQFAEITNRRNTGEISVFASTEFQKNLFAGISLGIINGSINYDRSFQEVDENNFYNDGVIPPSGSDPATDIFSITLTDEIDTNFYGFSARGGMIYKPLPFLNLGASIVAPSKIFVTESFFSNIRTEFDDETFTDGDETTFSGEFEYAVTRPAELKVGATLQDIGNLTISASAEYIDYSSTKVDFTINTGDLDPSDVAILKEDEDATNQSISSTYNAVINFKASAAYSFNKDTKIIAGYALLPGKEDFYQFEEIVYSGGITFPIAENISLDISGQYSSRGDRSIVYEFENNVQSVSKEKERLNILAGVKFRF
ncbi:MAG: hypothetical protein JJ892_10680 [Balneola sp.]|nr:hypothetical protein [Balneola sp.]MBO6650990.1 hypothetical protein [Balneola sp.]MBO6711151.1 hypothetical protein [Balneola sp.]MBO6800735.1 hypothetical protein [Balneola sp.]MBO6869086.1 hypothetical protein [Balneola sp.]